MQHSLGEVRSAYNILIRKPEGKRPFGRHKLRCEGNIRIDVREMDGKVGTGFIWLRIGTIVNTVMNLRVP
jgi:hypothetical protein